MSFDRDCAVQGWPDYDGLVSRKTIGLWTPAQRTTRLWLDFADTSTLTLASSKLSSVVDKSGNSITYSQSTDANRPDYLSSSTGGLPAISYNGSTGNYFMDSTTSIQTNNSGNMTLLFFGSRNGDGCIFTERLSSALQAFQYINIPPYILLSSANGDAGSNQFTNTNTTGNAIIIYQHTPEARGRVWVNGAELTIDSGTCTNITGSAGSRLGRREASRGFSWNGLMYEVVAELTTLTDTTRQLYEGYFAWKRGLASLLPNNHPYKNAAPTL